MSPAQCGDADPPSSGPWFWNPVPVSTAHLTTLCCLPAVECVATVSPKAAEMFRQHHHHEANPDTSVPALAPTAAPWTPLSFVFPDGELHEDRKPVHSVHGRVLAVPATEPGILSILNQRSPKEPTDEREPGKVGQPGSCHSP